MINYIQIQEDALKVFEASKPIIMGVGSVSFVTLIDIELYLKIIILLLTGAYTLWKWRTEYKQPKKPENGDKTN